MRLGSLFAGIGGFDLAARWMGWETAWFSEIDPYASAVLAKHWPGVPNHGDITKIDFARVEPVDMLCGGFPCQDISNAGKRKGIEGERSGLWGEYARAIGELRPRYVVVENVAALLGRGVERVLGDLAALGYDAEWTVLSAADVGAPHLRERLWIVAYPANHGIGRWLQFPKVRDDSGAMADAGRIGGESGREAGYLDRARGAVEGEARKRERRGDAVDNRRADVADTDLAGLERRYRPIMQERSGELATWPGSTSTGERGGVRWLPEPDVGRVAHGVPARMDRLRGLGNAIVPQCALEIFRAIEAAEAMRERAA